MATQIAYVHILSGEITCITISDDEDFNGDHSQPSGTVCTTINPHLETTVTYEIVDNLVTAVSQTDVMNRMNDPDDTTVVAPT
jgi:hypothetical protein